MIPDHACNVCCTPDEHCELVYANSADAGAIAQAYGYYAGVVVTRVEPAREAPPPDQLDPATLAPLTPAARRRTSDEHRLLVCWREP